MKAAIRITTKGLTLSQIKGNFDHTIYVSPIPFTMTPGSQLSLFQKRKENYQPNAITLSQQEFSYIERKLLMFCINQIDHQLISEGANLRFKIPVKALGTNYGRMEDVCESITSKKIRSLSKNSFGVIVPFPEAKYVIEEGFAYVELVMFANVVPFFIDLKNKYTSYSFETMLSLKSVYTQRIFEIIMMELKGKKRNVFNYNLADLQFVLGSDYQNFADFKRRVLDPAAKELKEKAEVTVDYYVVNKEGKKVTELQFVVKSKRQVLMEETKNDIYEWSVMDERGLCRTCEGILPSYSFTFNQVNMILGDMKLLRKFMLLHSQITSGEIPNVKSPTSYIAQSLGFGKTPGKKKSVSPRPSKSNFKI